MIGEIIRNAAFPVEGEVVAGPIPVPPGRATLGIRFDGNAANPDCEVTITCEFSADGGATWREIGGLTMHARAVAQDLPDFPGSAFTLVGTHDGTEGLGRLRVSCPFPATFEVATDF